MALPFPNYPENVGGDEPTLAPTKNDRAILGAERGTQFARRIETDADRNLYVRVAVSDVAPPAQVSALASDELVDHPDSVLGTILTYTAPADQRVTRISASGTVYAKYQLFLDTVLIETRRATPHGNVEFDFVAPLGVASGQILDVKVTHLATGILANFESTIYGA